MTANPLGQPLNVIRGVGPKLWARLQDLGLHTLEDVLFHLPIRYQDRTRVSPIGGLADGQEALVCGVVRAAGIAQGRRRMLVAKVEDDSGMLTLRFFHFRKSQADQMRPGEPITLFGQARWNQGKAEMVHPEYRLGREQPEVEAALTPIYPSTEGVGQVLWKKLSDAALTVLAQSPPVDLLDPGESMGFTLDGALRYLHRPPAAADVAAIQNGEHPAQERLALEELIAHQLSLRSLRATEKSLLAPRIEGDDQLSHRFVQSLPFSPTGAQIRVQQEIQEDLGRDTPMLRLVQGDVGSGKTLVAARAALAVVGDGLQVALMAPTELLAEQHYRQFSRWFEPLGIAVGWLSGKVKGKSRTEVLSAMGSGKVQMTIGTHALFQEQVQFQSLGLVIVDEQHRFGVHQRLALTQKGDSGRLPHQLVMTATPIPRTLAMLAYADLDCSVIDELPPGRTPIKTTLLENGRRDDVIHRVGEACRSGRQAYWVCTLIEDSEALDARPAESTAELLETALPDVRIGLIHGRLGAEEKEAVMAAFAGGSIQLLVATTVIEVGVDVPNASLMIIENPERLGLAQLHQLRGRVGRGSTDSYCLLLYQSPLSQNGKERLSVLRDSTDGFFIAEEDLRLRGPGEVLGTRQTGLAAFRVARLPEHQGLLERAARIAPGYEADSDEVRRKALIDRWTGERQAFARV